jgi:hypothetical protein
LARIYGLVGILYLTGTNVDSWPDTLAWLCRILWSNRRLLGFGKSPLLLLDQLARQRGCRRGGSRERWATTCGGEIVVNTNFWLL